MAHSSSCPSVTLVDNESLSMLPPVRRRAPEAPWYLPRRAMFQTYVEAILEADGLWPNVTVNDVLHDRSAQNFQDHYPNWKRSAPPESEPPKLPLILPDHEPWCDPY